jgi:Amt family ammonium transporter
MVAGLTRRPQGSSVHLAARRLVLRVAWCLTYAVGLIKTRFKIDDSLDVFADYGAGPILGQLLSAPFSATGPGGLGLPKDAPVGGQFVD